MPAASDAVVTEAIEYQLDGVTFHGHLARPAEDGARRPGVLVAPEWWGLNPYARRRAEQLAALGYVALAIDMYGEGKVTSDAATASAWAGTTRTGPLSRRRSARALQWLQSHPSVRSDRIAGVGFCFGGSVMLELARSGAEVRGVASFHGSLATPLPAERGVLRAAVLVLHGADDPYVTDEEVLTFRNEMRAAGADWRICLFGGAVHSFSNPDADVAGLPGLAYHAPSERRGWRTFLAFLEESLS